MKCKICGKWHDAGIGVGRACVERLIAENLRLRSDLGQAQGRCDGMAEGAKRINAENAALRQWQAEAREQMKVFLAYWDSEDSSETMGGYAALARLRALACGNVDAAAAGAGEEETK